jgi:hypothetical protein
MNAILYGLPSAQLNKLQRVLNSSARLLCNIPRDCSITPALKDLMWLPIRERISLKILLWVYTSLNGSGPIYLTEFINIHHNIRDLRSSNETILEPPPPKLATYGERSFPTAAAKLWNQLPQDIKTSPSMPTFKNRLKMHLLIKCYGAYEGYPGSNSNPY